LPSFEDEELQKLDNFLKTDAYLSVANHRQEIADFIDQNYSFYSMIDKFLSGKPIQLLTFDNASRTIMS
jgi:hypothetical protein